MLELPPRPFEAQSAWRAFACIATAIVAGTIGYDASRRQIFIARG